MTTPEQSVNGITNPKHSAAELVAESRNVFQSPPKENPAQADISTGDNRSSCPDEKVAEGFCMHVHKYITDFIKFADQKAAFCFALSTSLLCFGYKANLHLLWMKSPKTYILVDTMCIISMCCLAIGLATSVWVIIPNLRKSHRGFVFFGSIAEYKSSTEYASVILGSNSTHLRRALLQHTYDIAIVCNNKYWWLGRSLWFTAIGVILFVVVLFIK